MPGTVTVNLGLNKPDFNEPIWHDDVNFNFDLLDAVIFAITGIGNFVGAWTNSTAYLAGNRVFDNDDGGIWQCQVSHASAATGTFSDDRTANPTFWTEIGTIPSVQGAWANNTTYSVGTIVYDAGEGLFGQANTNHTSLGAPNTMRDDIAKWDIFFDWQVVVTAADVPFTPTGAIAATNVQAAIAEVDTEKAPLASPALTGTPTAPTAAPGTDTTQISTTAFVKAAIDVVLGGVSASFDTLSEIVAGFVQLGNTSYLHPVGSILDYAGATEPSGWVFCYGQAISRTTFSALFTVIGTTYGAGDGSTTFNVPDCRGRVAAGQDDMGGTSANRLTGLAGGVDGDVLGAAGGAESFALAETNLPAHTHPAGTLAVGTSITNGSNIVQSNAFQNGVGVGGAVDDVPKNAIDVPLSLASGAVTGATGSTGSGTAMPHIQPTIILNKIIKT